MNIIQNMLPQSKWPLKSPFTQKVEYITIHNTGNDAAARNEVAYMLRNSSQTGYHYAVDDKEIIQAIPDNRNAWHAGDGGGKGNRASIGIEICYSKSGGARFLAAEKLAAKLVAQKLKEHGLTIDRVRRHYDWSGKNCPHRTMELGWPRFLAMVKLEEGGKEVIEKGPIKIDGKVVHVDKILKDGQNYVKLSDLAKYGLKVRYDQVAKMSVINIKG